MIAIQISTCSCTQICSHTQARAHTRTQVHATLLHPCNMYPFYGKQNTQISTHSLALDEAHAQQGKATNDRDTAAWMNTKGGAERKKPEPKHCTVWDARTLRQSLLKAAQLPVARSLRITTSGLDRKELQGLMEVY